MTGLVGRFWGAAFGIDAQAFRQDRFSHRVLVDPVTYSNTTENVFKPLRWTVFFYIPTLILLFELFFEKLLHLACLLQQNKVCV